MQKPLTTVTETLSLFTWRRRAWRQACLKAASRWLKAGQVDRCMRAIRLS